MYHIRLIEDGHFATVIGGPIKTLAVALEQINALCENTDASELDGYTGCRWTRGGTTTCFLLVVDDLGQPIKSVKEE